MATGDAATTGSTKPADQPGSGPTALPLNFLSQALQRLTSEILIYLLGYAVLVASLIIWGGSVNPALRNILYILPPLGIAAYIYQQRRRVKSKRLPRVAVSALFTGRGGSVLGIEGLDYKGDVSVKAGIARGGSEVVGVKAGKKVEPLPADITYLTALFGKLDNEARQKVIRVAMQHQPRE